MFTMMYLGLAFIELIIGIMEIICTVLFNIAIAVFAMLGALFSGILKCFKR